MPRSHRHSRQNEYIVIVRPAPAPPNCSHRAIRAYACDTIAESADTPLDCSNIAPIATPPIATITAGANNCSNILAPRFIDTSPV